MRRRNCHRVSAKSLFWRTKIQEGGKNIEEVLNWYKEVNAQTLKYVTYSIHDSDISDFYRLLILRIILFIVHVQQNASFRWIIGYKNLLRAAEFSGRAGILGLEYLSSDEFSNSKFEQFLQADVLRREYLNQTFNFLPFLWVNKKNLTRPTMQYSHDQLRLRETFKKSKN